MTTDHVTNLGASKAGAPFVCCDRLCEIGTSSAESAFARLGPRQLRGTETELPRHNRKHATGNNSIAYQD